MALFESLGVPPAKTQLRTSSKDKKKGRKPDMNKNLVHEIAATQIRTDLPDFRTGDTIQVSVRIIENGKERTQMFQGVCIARRGANVSETFIVRKFSNGIGVERNFPVNSPIIASITIVKHGKVRRNKIYYLRDRKGKSARLTERL